MAEWHEWHGLTRMAEAYAARLLDFVDRYAPRRPITVAIEAAPPSRVVSQRDGTGPYPAELDETKLGNDAAPDVRTTCAVGSTQ
jgi:hypothetical protein